MGYIGGFKVFDADAKEIQDLLDWNTQSFGRGVSIGDTTYEVFQDGSEVICDNPKFDKYKNSLDFVFTSIYFTIEV